MSESMPDEFSNDGSDWLIRTPMQKDKYKTLKL